MSKVTRHTMKRVVSALEESYFTFTGFAVDFPDDGAKYLVITFLDDDSFFFSVEPSTRYTDGYAVQYAPGSVTRVSHYTTQAFDSCLESIDKWCDNIREELIAGHPLFSEFQQLRESVKQTIDERFKDATESFGPEELEKLRVDLDELAARFQDLQDKNAITEQDLEAIKDTVEELKADAQYFPKKTWYRTAGSKFVNLVSSILSSKPAQKLLQESTRKLLGLPGE